MHSHPHKEEEEMEELSSSRYSVGPMLLDIMSKEFITRDNLEACQFNGGDEEFCCSGKETHFLYLIFNFASLRCRRTL